MTDRSSQYLPPHEAGDDLTPVRDALRGLRFGQVTVTVQDGVIVQIERLEKRRVTREDRSRTSLPNRASTA